MNLPFFQLIPLFLPDSSLYFDAFSSPFLFRVTFFPTSVFDSVDPPPFSCAIIRPSRKALHPLGVCNFSPPHTLPFNPFFVYIPISQGPPICYWEFAHRPPLRTRHHVFDSPLFDRTSPFYCLFSQRKTNSPVL